LGVGDIAADRNASDPAGELLRRVEIEIEDRDLRAFLGERARGLGAEAGSAASDDGWLSVR
jgi:hypothetical protein